MSMQMLEKSSLNESWHRVGEVEFFEDHIPSFAEDALESLYQCLMSTLLRFGQHYPLETAKTYVAYKNGVIKAIFIFRLEKKRVVVYNEQVSINSDELTQFARHAFERYPEVSQLSFYAIDTGKVAIPFAYHSVECLEDIWFKLPAKSSDYMPSLGKKTAETIKRADKKIRRDHPTFRMEFFSNEDVKEEDISKIVLLNCLRMQKKGTSHYHTNDSVAKLMELVRRYGLVGLAFVNGEVCGGVIQLRVGSHWFSHTICHHPDYDVYRLGQLCNYYGVIATIDNGGGVFHFGWGRSEHKYRMGGCNRELFKLEIYRGPASMLADVLGILNRAVSSQRRKLKLWIAEQEQIKDSRLSGTIKSIRSARSASATWLKSRSRLIKK